MNIGYVKIKTRVGEIVIDQKSEGGKGLVFKLDKDLKKEDFVSNSGRVYYIVVNNEIVKIGGSQCKGGIKNTFYFYFSGYKGNPSPRSYCCWNFIHKAITNKKKVEVYFVLAPMVEASIPTMGGFKKVNIPIDFHTMENDIVSEYVRVENRYPYLNVQESGGKWHSTGLLDEGYPGITS